MCLGALALTLAIALPLAGHASDGPSFRPDASLSLKATHPIGAATWTLSTDGLSVDLGKSGQGVLMLDGQYENLGLYAEASCTSCVTGLLIRAVPDGTGGLAGILVSASKGAAAMEQVRIDAAGRIVDRTPLLNKAGNSGLPSPFGVIVSDAMKSAPPFKPLPLPPGVKLPELDADSGAWRPGWNAINLTAYGTALNAMLNGGQNAGLTASTLPATPDYGKVALYVAGSGKVAFRHVLARDLDMRDTSVQQTDKGWERRQLDPWAMAWGVATGDINRDGVTDIVAGQYWWEGPDFTRAHEIATPTFYNPASDYPQKSFISFARDFDGDGWPDVLTVSGNSGYSDVILYINPHGASRHWESRRALTLIGNEETLLVDIDGDGKPELVHAYDHSFAYSKSNADATQWTTTKISAAGPWGEYVGHGLGVGDINSDGRMDLVSAYGWWEQPSTHPEVGNWTYHPVALGRRGASQGGAGGAQIGVYDVNGDGLPDVVTTLEGHSFGLAWYEQQHKGSKIGFVRHMIMDGFLDDNAGGVIFTEPHGATFADIDGDGVPDLVTGKRLMSHLFNLKDPDATGAAVLYVYRTVRDKAAPGGARFEPMLVDNASGVGSHPLVTDVDGDGRPDILVSGALGTFLFSNRLPKIK